MTKKRDPEQLQDGEEWKLQDGHGKIECCDCSLCHDLNVYRRLKGGGLKPLKGTIVLRLFRDEQATELARKGKAKPR